jgi:AcrR family transcriptional regulator
MRTDERIVGAMGELLRVQGYAATGVKQVAADAGVPIGSLYHFFPGGKREIASAALRATGAAYIQLLPLLLDPYDDLVAGVEAFFAAAADDAESNGWLNMCPVGTVTGEVADSEPALRQVAEEVLGSWISQGTDYLRGRGLDESARTATVALLGALEGAFILSRGLHSAEPLLAAGRSMAAYVATLPTPGRISTRATTS